MIRHQAPARGFILFKSTVILKAQVDNFPLGRSNLNVQKVSPRDQFYFASILNSRSEPQRILIQNHVRVPNVRQTKRDQGWEHAECRGIFVRVAGIATS